MHLRTVLTAAATASLLSAQTLADPPRTLSVEDAVQEAIGASAQIQAARARADSSDFGSKSVRGRLLPALQASDAYQHYDSPFTIRLGPQPITARNINTNTATVSGSQPLLGLLRIGNDYAASNRSADAARADAQATEAAVAESVRVGFLRLFEAKAEEQIAQASRLQLAEQLDVQRARFQSGVVTKADVLRVETSVANARQQEIQAQVQGQIARQTLLTLLGRNPADPSIEFLEPTELEAQTSEPPPEVDGSIRQALVLRPEVLRARAQADAAHDTARARAFELLPELNLEAAYVHVSGQLFVPQDSAYVGFVASWPFWDWGTRFYAAKSAASQASAAESLAEDERRQVAFDVSSKHAEVQAVKAAVDVAHTAIASAEEAFRVTHAQVNAGTATTTDLLDAQSALTTARSNLARAQYELAISRVTLERATTGK